MSTVVDSISRGHRIQEDNIENLNVKRGMPLTKCSGGGGGKKQTKNKMEGGKRGKGKKKK